MTTPATLTVAQSKPQLQAQLRATWRKSAEHKAAQIKRFIYAMVAVVVANIVPEIVAGKNPLDHFTDARTAWYYLLPFAYIAWKQAHPSMSASEADSAPGVTIVPEQVGAEPDVPADPPPPITEFTPATPPVLPADPDAVVPDAVVSDTPEDDSGLANLPLTLAAPRKTAAKKVAKKAPAKKARPRQL